MVSGQRDAEVGIEWLGRSSRWNVLVERGTLKKEREGERGRREKRKKRTKGRKRAARGGQKLSLSCVLSSARGRRYFLPCPSFFALLRSAPLCSAQFCSSPRLFSHRGEHFAAPSSPTKLFATPLTLDGGGSSGNCVSIFALQPSVWLSSRSFVCLTPKGNCLTPLHSSTSARKFHRPKTSVRFTNDDSPRIDFHLPSRGYPLRYRRNFFNWSLARKPRETDRNFRQSMNIRSRRWISRKLDCGARSRRARSGQLAEESFSLGSP